MRFNLQTILLIVFGFFTLIGVAVFAGYIDIGGSSKTATPSGKVTLWGTLNERPMNAFLKATEAKNQTFSIDYVQKDSASYEQALIEALASGKGPDLFLVTPDMFWRERDKMYVIPYASMPLQNYNASYMDIARAYTSQDGIYALPLFIDPIVGYWNKDMFGSVGLANPPKLWKELPELSKKLSIVENDFSITKSAVALGEYRNILNAKEILSLMFFQTGSPILKINNDQNLVTALDEFIGDQSDNPLVIALSYFMQFSNPTSGSTYSWNASFTNDRNQFLSGNLAYYFGLGSEIASIRKTNPNLNFALAIVPQLKDDGAKITSGLLYGLAMSKQTKNLPLASYVLGQLTSKEKMTIMLSSFAEAGLTYSPARREMIPNNPEDPYATTLYQSALISKSFIDPNPSVTDSIFSEMISDIKSGKSDPEAALSDAKKKFDVYLKQIAIPRKNVVK